MTDSEKLAKLVDHLRIIAARSTQDETDGEDFNVDGIFDEAMGIGFEDGMTVLARDLLELIGRG